MFYAGKVRTLTPVLLLAPLVALADIRYVSQEISLTLQPMGKLSVPPVTLLSSPSATFQAFAGTLGVTFRVRTSPSGAGVITMQAASEFSPAGGPSIASGALTYTCAGASLGTACVGSQTVSLGTQTHVLSIPPSACTGGGGACSAGDPNSVQVNFTLLNDPQLETGIYTGLITLTISAT